MASDDPLATPEVSAVPTATVNGRSCDFEGVEPAHLGARLAARARAHRRQGGLRRGRVRRLLGARRPTRRRRRRRGGPPSTRASSRPPSLDGQEVVTAEGLGTPDEPAPRAARDGRAGRVAVRLLHARLRLQHGCRVLPGRRSEPRRPRAATRAPTRGPTAESTGPTASTCTPCRATCAGAPATARSATPPTPSAAPRPTTPSPLRQGRPAPAAVATRFDPPHRHLRPGHRPRRRLRPAGRPPRGAPRRRLHRLGRGGQPARRPGALRHRHRPGARAAHGRDHRGRTSSSAPR